MPGFSPDEIVDLVNTTLIGYDKVNWQDESLTTQSFTVADYFLKGKKTTFDTSNTSYTQSWILQNTNSGNARSTTTFDNDTTNIVTLTKTATQKWAMHTTSFGFDIYEEKFQGDAVTIVKEVDIRRHSMMNDMWVLWERQFWSSPSSSSVTPRPLYGVPYWLQKSTTLGFGGGDPSGFSSGCGDISVTGNTWWKNFTGTYSAFTQKDVLFNMRSAFRQCVFKAPDPYKMLTSETPNWMLFTTATVQDNLEQLLTSSNNNIRDLAGYNGAAVPKFKNVPVEWVPVLDDNSVGNTAYDSTNPIYGINWGDAKFEFASGKELIISEPRIPQNGGHTMRAVFGDSQSQLAFKRRRGSFVFYKV